MSFVVFRGGNRFFLHSPRMGQICKGKFKITLQNGHHILIVNIFVKNFVVFAVKNFTAAAPYNVRAPGIFS